ncbi:hypothetical protein V500_01794 [Pseudogymnoascus sp. VKM F-4518 (FW-2643)]|nr:hypothetical protein V500_01794 [Pseudogymnoascus sp. VKM F-4518 (FW-2643)]
MTAVSDIEHSQINATVYKDRVEQIRYDTIPARNIRQRPQTEVWKIERLLGRGGFGEYKETGAFVQFFSWFKDGNDVFVAMEYVPLGDLKTNIAAHSGKILEVEALDITRQILLGLEIMQAECYAHRDLKPQNVLVVHGPPQCGIKSLCIEFIKGLLEPHPKERPSASQALADTWVMLGFNNLSQSNQETSRFSEFTASNIDYNTASHNGLKSYRLPSPSHTDSSYTQYSSQTQSASDINSLTVSQHLTVTRKSLATSDSESMVKQLSTEEEATPPKLKLDILANPLFTKESPAMLQLVPNRISSSQDGKTMALSPDNSVRSLVGGLLSQRQGSSVRIVRRDGPALGRGDGRRPTDAQGPYRRGQVGGLLSRRQGSGVRIVRQDDPALGRGDGRRPADAQRPYRRGHVGGLLSRRQGGGVRI